MAEEAIFKAGPGTFQATEEMVQAYKKQGYVLIRGLLTPEEVQHVRSAVDDPQGVLQHEYKRSSTGEKAARMSLWQHPGTDVTGVLMRINKMAATAEKLMGGDEIYHYHSKLMMKKAKTGGAHVWHQDYGYWYYNTALLPEMSSVFVPVDACRKENGCLQVLTGSHRLGRLDHVTVGEQLGAEPERLKMVQDKYPLHFVEMDPGDVLFFDCCLLHSSSQNDSDKRRYVLIGAYNKKLNDPIQPKFHPRFTPMEKLPDSALLECSNVRDLTGKDFLRGEDDDTHLKPEKNSAAA